MRVSAQKAVEKAITEIPKRNSIKTSRGEFEVRHLYPVRSWKTHTEPSRHAGSMIIGADSSGNLFLCAPDGSVSFWDHETNDETVLSASVEDFCDSLIEPTPVVLRPGQVKRVWVNPDFRSKLARTESATQPTNTRNPLRLLLHIPVPWVFILTYLVGVCFEQAFPLAFAVANIPAINLIGAALFAIGAAIAAWGLITFRKARTTTVPGRTSSQLVTWGPYRFTRNPMYVGLSLAYLGEAGLLRQTWPPLLLPLTIAYVNWIVIPLEETKLKEAFAEAYDQYRATVRRWI